MGEHDKADEEAEGVVKEVTKVLLDFGVLWKHIDDLLEKNFLFCTEISFTLDFSLQMSSEMICIALTVILWHQNLPN